MTSIKVDEELVVVHVIEKDCHTKKEVPIPDYRTNKPLGFYDQKDESVTFIQKLIKTEIDGVKFSFSAPNEISLSLSVFDKSRKIANELRKEVLSHSKNSDGALYEENVKTAYDFLEEIQKAVVFGYKAIEVFCNATIPDEYEYKKINSKGIEELYRKEQIERWITTSEKVSEILPNILNISSPTKEEFWPNFKSLERIRNEIIHSKSRSSPSTLSELFSVEIEKYLSSSLKPLHFFIEKDPDNPIFPLGFGESIVRVTLVDDIKNHLILIS